MFVGALICLYRWGLYIIYDMLCLFLFMLCLFLLIYVCVIGSALVCIWRDVYVDMRIYMDVYVGVYMFV